MLRNIYMKKIYIHIRMIYKQGGYKYQEDIYIIGYKRHTYGEIYIEKYIYIKTNKTI